MLPIAHGEGRYQCDIDTLHSLEDDDSIALRYVKNPNGSVANIAGITNNNSKLTYNKKYPDGTPRKILDNRIIKKLGWKSKVSLKDGLKKTLDWYHDQKK